MIGGVTGRPVANSTGPGSPMPTPRSSVRSRPDSSSRASNAPSSHVRTVAGPRPRRCPCAAGRGPCREIRDLRRGVGGADVAGQDDAGAAVEGQHGRRPSARGGTVASGDEQAAGQQRADAPTVERARPVSATRSPLVARPVRTSSRIVPAVPADPFVGGAAEARATGDSEPAQLVAVKGSKVVGSHAAAIFRLTIDRSCRKDDRRGGARLGLPGMKDGALRVGIIGAGFIGAVHAHAARRAGARVVGVSSSTPASTKDAVDRLGAEQGFLDAATLARSPEIDVVHICTPNHLHVPLSAAALDAGKHVVCEKPLAMNDAEATDLCARVSAGIVASVPFVYRFYPMVREARARLARAPGTIRLVHGSYLQDWLSTADDDNWRVDAEWSGRSRAFADIGSHWCDLVEFVTATGSLPSAPSS